MFKVINEILRGLRTLGITPKGELHTGSIHPWTKVHGFLESFNEVLKKRKYWILTLFIIALVMWWGGFFAGWWWSSGRMGLFPSIDSKTRLLVISPHPDDDVLMSGGLIQKVLSVGGEVRVIYLTMGDRSIGSVIRMDKMVKFAPTEFLSLGEKRRNEAIKAESILGVEQKNLYFLCFPDGGLQEVLARDKLDERGPVVSKSTKLDHVSYIWAYKSSQSFFEEELISDLEEIISDFKPNVVVTTHSRDSHPDHRAAFEVMEMIKNQQGTVWPIYVSLIHFRSYPDKGDFLFPPRKLFNNRWLSLELTEKERKIKLIAIESFNSQINKLDRSWYERFDAFNEIFEEE